MQPGLPDYCRSPLQDHSLKQSCRQQIKPEINHATKCNKTIKRKKKINKGVTRWWRRVSDKYCSGSQVSARGQMAEDKKWTAATKKGGKKGVSRLKLVQQMLDYSDNQHIHTQTQYGRLRQAPHSSAKQQSYISTVSLLTSQRSHLWLCFQPQRQHNR